MSHRSPWTVVSARRQWVLGVAFATTVTLALNACEEKDAKAAAPANPVVSVGPENIAVASSDRLHSGPAISGTLTPEHQATARAEVSGAVVQTYVEKGQPVKAGALLARIDDTALRESWLSARSAERSAKLTLDNARRDLERNRRLEAEGAIAQRDLEAAQRALAAAEAGYADAQARLVAAQKQLAKTQIRAPWAGVVSDRPVNAGDVVQTGTALVTIVDPASMRLEATVPADQVVALKVGAPVEFTVNGYPGRTFTGKIARINPTADPATRQVRIYVTIPNGEGTLVGGLFAQGIVAVEAHQALLVPASAVDQRGAMPTVIRLANGRVQSVPVQLGTRDESTDRIEVRSGLSAGDTVLLGAAQGITPGTQVRVLASDEGAGQK
jgi:RND family efflux transporter MFP subunit